MKIKKLLALLVAIVIVFAGLPTITSSAATVTTLMNQTYTFTNANYNNCNMYFTVPQRGAIRLDCTRLMYNGSETYNYYKLYNQYGQLVWEANSTRSSIANSSIPQFLIALDAGTYRLNVNPGWVSSSRSYQFQAAAIFIPANNYETEENNTKATADVVSFNNVFSGFTDNSDDYFAITVSKDTLVKIKLSKYKELRDKYIYPKLHLADNSSQSFSLLNQGEATDHTYFFALLKAGTNYIQIPGEYGFKSSVEYSMEITPTTVPTPTINNLKVSGTKVEVSWNQLFEVTGYEIYRKINNGSWSLLLAPYGNQYIGFWNSGIDFSKSYQYRIRSYISINGTKYYSAWSKVKALIPTPTNIKFSQSNYSYDGKVKTPSLVIKDITGRTLKKGTDYTVSYPAGRKAIGKYKVTITFKGNYSGKKTATFSIGPKNSKISKLTAAKKSLKVKFKKQSKDTSGYQIQYSTSKSFKSAKTVTVKGKNKTSVTIKKLKSKKTYYVRVRTYKTIKGSKVCSAWSSAKKSKKIK